MTTTNAENPTTASTAANWWQAPEYGTGDLELPGQSRLSANGKKTLEQLSQLADGGKLAIPQLPKAAAATLKLLRENTLEPEEIAKSVGTDPVLSAEVLRLANSPLYGCRVPIDTLIRAILHVGMRKIRTLIMEVTMHSVAGTIQNKNWATMEWRFSVHCASVAKAIGAHMGEDPETCYLAGLLRDIGRLPVLAALESRKVLEPTPEPGGDSEIILESLHRGLGRQVAKLWDLPPAVADAIANHMNGRRADEDTSAQFKSTIAAEAAGDLCHALGFGRFKRPFAIADARSLKDCGLAGAPAPRFFEGEFAKAVAVASAIG